MSLIKNPLLLKAKSVLRNRAPGLLVLGSRVLARTVFYKKERAYLAGERVSSGSLASVLLFAPERCATQYTNTLVSTMYDKVGGHSVILPNYYFHASPKSTKNMSDRTWLKENLEEKGYFYGSVGMLRTGGQLDLSPYTVLATVRDPRDILVSAFYSIAYAHTPSNKQFFLDAEEAREKGIDWFVQQEWRIESIKEKIRFIYDEIKPLPHSLVWRYEDMMGEFDQFITSLAKQVAPGEDLDEVVQSLTRERQEQMSNKEENVLKHMRSGESKQYEKKLKPETIEFLNTFFEQELKDFGYNA